MFPGIGPVRCVPPAGIEPASHTGPHFECGACTNFATGVFLCCAATIRTWNTSAKNLGVAVTPRRNVCYSSSIPQYV